MLQIEINIRHKLSIKKFSTCEVVKYYISNKKYKHQIKDIDILIILIMSVHTLKFDVDLDLVAR